MNKKKFVSPEEYSEHYKFLRTNIKYHGPHIQVITVTSSYFGEGKTTVSANLAKTFQETGFRTILLDLDLRRPMIRNYFQQETNLGITNILENRIDYHTAISHDPQAKGLDIIHTGPIPPNAPDLLSTKVMVEFINQLKKEYDYVIIDTPPVGEYTDAVITAALSDGVVICSVKNETSLKEIQETKERLEKVNANIIGVVTVDLNR